MDGHTSFRVAEDQLPELYPTHRHEASFWEMLGRAVATFGYLEHVLARAIFAITGTKEYTEGELQAALTRWIPALESSLSGTLDRLIKTYAQAVPTTKAPSPMASMT